MLLRNRQKNTSAPEHSFATLRDPARILRSQFVISSLNHREEANDPHRGIFLGVPLFVLLYAGFLLPRTRVSSAMEPRLP